MKYILFILFTGCVVQANAQGSFSLGQCIDYTLKKHPSVLVYQNNVAIARERSTQSIAGYLPQVTASATMLDNLQLQTTVLPAGILGPDPKEVQFGTKYNTNAGIDLNQTIYDQSKIAGIKANKPYQAMTKLQEAQNRETLIYNTSNAYFQVLIYREQLAILKTNLYKYEEMVKVLQYQYEKGTVLEKDVDRVRVNLNTTNYQITDAATKEQLAVNTLKNAMGMPLETFLQVEDTIDYTQFARNEPADSLSLAALTEVKINEQSILLQEINVKTKQAAFLPTLSAIGKYSTQSLNNDFSKAFSTWNDYYYIGLSLNLPLFNGFKRKSLVREEKLNLKNEVTNFTLNKQNLQLRYENAHTSLGTAYSSYQSNKDNMELAKKLLSVTDYQYQRGVASLTDYLNDDAAYKAAQSNYISSLYNLMISQLNYHKSKGTLLPFTERIK